MTIRSWMSSIMGLISLEQPESLALELKKLLYFTLLHSSIYKYQSISTKLGQNIYDHKILDEFDSWYNLTRLTGVICPCIKKNAIFDFG